MLKGSHYPVIIEQLPNVSILPNLKTVTKKNKARPLAKKTPSIHLNTILKGSGVNFAGSVGRQFFGVIFVLLLSRYLSTRELGLYFLGFNIIMFLSTLCLAGTENGLIRFISIYQKDLPKEWNMIISALIIVMPISIICSLILLFKSDYISIAIFHKPDLEIVVKGLSLFLPFFSFSLVCLSATQGRQLMHYRVLYFDILNNIIRILLTFFLLMLGMKLFGVIVGTLFSIAVVMLFSAHGLLKVFGFPIKPRSFVADFGALLRFSLPQTLSSILNRALGMVDTILLGYFSIAEDVGTYNIALKIALMGTLALSSFNTIYSPIISELHSQNRYEELERTYQVVTRWIFTISLPLYAFYICFPELVLSVFGKSYASGALCLTVICFGQLINVATGPCGLMIIMSGHQYLNFFNNLLSFFILVATNVIMIPRYGILGAAAGLAASFSIVNIIRVFQVYCLLKMQPYHLDMLKSVLAVIFSSLFVFLISKALVMLPNIIILGVTGTLFILMYALILYLLKFDDTDIYFFRKAVRRFSVLKTDMQPKDS